MTAAALWRLAGEAWARRLRALPGAEVWLTPRGWLLLSGAPVADLNLAYVAAGPGAADQLREFSRLIRARDASALVLLARAVADELAPLAAGLGLHPAGATPLMTYRPAGPGAAPPAAGDYAVRRVTGTNDLPAVRRLLADANGLPLASLARAMPDSVLDVAGTAVFLTRYSDEPVGAATTTATDDGAIVGIWDMATAPAWQRRGIGRATLAAVMAYHVERGAGLFYLDATPAGLPLYARAGFRTIEETAVWVAGASTQFPGS
ncbi:MAG TPA: GNAT family N-acetyltransferase [Thermomicrobiales bacterium]|nr:GNAT family N-acetyltransferase [Thermomicrobiales bacterium]